MTMQSENKWHGFANNLPLQLGVMGLVVMILIALAAHYVW
jgi:hypothetical protein